MVLTKADRDGHGGKTSSSALYPHTFFGESTGKGSTNFRSGNQRLERIGKQSSLESSQQVLSQVDQPQQVEVRTGNFVGSSRIGKQSSLETSQHVQSHLVQHPIFKSHSSSQRNTFFNAPLTNRQGSNTGNFVGSGRIGKQSSLESSQQVQSQVFQPHQGEVRNLHNVRFK